jgi:hypothetical protein
VTWLAALTLIAGSAVLGALGTIGYLLRTDRVVAPKPTHLPRTCERCHFPILTDECSCRNVPPSRYIDRWPVVPRQRGESDDGA